MYFHGLDGVGHQVSRVAIPQNGIDFTARPEGDWPFLYAHLPA